MNRIVISWFYYSVKIKYEEINLNWNFKQKNIRLQMSIAVIYVFLLQSSFINTWNSQHYALSLGLPIMVEKGIKYSCSMQGKRECEERHIWVERPLSFFRPQEIQINSFVFHLFCLLSHRYDIKSIIPFNLVNCARFFKPKNCPWASSAHVILRFGHA